ncbi:hypothetical protein BJ322DRAFT_1017425 [Thelephora terrestris]|uniref:Uncharacterized protein n=1 Tax=Thelephora terrestris TaxID=56493 RepID=A0A9P6HMY8_9AGAM|nr:hypothetical protein BJ322DRAFT_1017425 [Thelephora terrestris]
MRGGRTRWREEWGRNEGIVGNYGTMKWRIKPRSQSGIGVEQAGGGEHGETVEMATTCNKRAGGTCSRVGAADQCGGIRTMMNKGARRVKSGGRTEVIGWHVGSGRLDLERGLRGFWRSPEEWEVARLLGGWRWLTRGHVEGGGFALRRDVWVDG